MVQVQGGVNRIVSGFHQFFGHCTDERFVNFLSGGFIIVHCSESNGQRTGKSHLCALVCLPVASKERKL